MKVSTVATRNRGGGCAAAAAAVVALVAVAAVVLVMIRPVLFGLGRESITDEQIGASFKQIAELSVEEYAYSTVGSFEQEGFTIAGRAVPFTGRNFLVTFDGSVKAGLRDAEQVAVDIDDDAEKLTVRVPRVAITENSVDPASISVYDQSMNPLNQVRVDDVAGFLAEQEKRAEEKAIEEGLLKRAEQRTEELMRSHASALIEGTNMAGYQVEVRWS
ncbi:DUF4230 domain-containing protein [Corynebacterium sanguinis]|uniref:DUF4230 domain-containing protein n=2 Tax=Corynebacterium TaxID=1716 RepID=C0XRR6_CORLD|nr:DUF4230 domain-containing protein [Corynebacterium sanguinis]EEI17007.1 hypothetical protein HMPREF0298_1136 [Corynebacterium lipophiloflavum DSM 44291]MBA4504824.1 DUF4230 domain-containing protein [Corynebacterium sanguinis]MCT1411250.1 DUF4230 domain-containing protein [Corynebacterium sanguinis]MCT1500188.1 DUF4230 domain-containing protein [Corynebacterium sanguinis]